MINAQEGLSFYLEEGMDKSFTTKKLYWRQVYKMLDKFISLWKDIKSKEN